MLPGGASLVAGEVPTGPHGGAISVTRIGGKPRLTEQLPNGTSIDYGAMNIALSGVGSHGFWRSADGAVVLAVRLLDEARYVLVRIDRDGKSTIFPAKNSLRHCAFTSDAMQGVCIHEGLVESPELVAVSTRTGSVRSVSEISPHYAAIKPLEMSTLSWTNSFGYTDNGFVIYPRGYRHGQRYPAIIITHSSDADQRFAAADLQWNYPAYLFAERGYVVLLVNDPSSFPSEALDRAQATWNSCDGRTPPWEVQRLIWLNTVESYRSLINRLNGEGLIDRDRLGIAGYSAGSQMVNVAVTQTHLFKAASSGTEPIWNPPRTVICNAAIAPSMAVRLGILEQSRTILLSRHHIAPDTQRRPYCSNSLNHGRAPLTSIKRSRWQAFPPKLHYIRAKRRRPTRPICSTFPPIAAQRWLKTWSGSTSGCVERHPRPTRKGLRDGKRCVRGLRSRERRRTSRVPNGWPRCPPQGEQANAAR